MLSLCMLYFPTFLNFFNVKSVFMCIKKKYVLLMSSCAELVAEFAGFGLLKQLCYGAGGKQRTCFSPDE